MESKYKYLFHLASCLLDFAGAIVMVRMRDLLRIGKTFGVRSQRIFYLTATDDLNVVAAKKEIDLVVVTFDNVDRVNEFRDDVQSKMFREYLKEGQHGVYAKFDGKVIGHAWAKVCRKNRCRVNGYIDIAENQALIHCCNVSACYRGNNMYPAMLVSLCHRLFCEAQVSRVIIDTEIDNYASLRGIAKVGFKPLALGIYFQFHGRLLFEYVKPIEGVCSDWRAYD